MPATKPRPKKDLKKRAKRPARKAKPSETQEEPVPQETVVGIEPAPEPVPVTEERAEKNGEEARPEKKEEGEKKEERKKEEGEQGGDAEGEKKDGNVREEKRRRRARTKRVAIVTLVLLLLVVLVAAGYEVYSLASEDLIVVLTPAASALTLGHGGQATVDFSLTTNNYLFCEASCDYTLTDVSDGSVVAQRHGIALQNSNVSFSLPFTAPAKGEGQIVYSLEVTCANVPQPLCGRSGTEHRAAAIVTLDYTLTQQEQAAKDAAASTLPAFLATARQADAASQDAVAAIASLQGPSDVPLDGLEAAVPALAQRRTTLLSDAAALLQRWQDEDYVGLNDSVPQTDADALLADADATLANVSSYVAAQHSLVGGLTATIADLWRWEQARRLFLADNRSADAASLGDGADALAGLAKRIAATPTGNILSRGQEFDALRNRSDQRFLTAASLALADAENITLLDAEERVALAASINGTNGTNVTNTNMTNETTNTSGDEPVIPTMIASSVTQTPDLLFSGALAGLSAACSGLNATAGELWAANLTPGNETTAALSRCAQTFSNTALLPDLSGLRFASVPLPTENATSALPSTLPVHEPQCCVFGTCAPCCDGGACDAAKYPVLFLHGHSMNARNSPVYTIEGFAAIQEQLQKDGVALDAGVLTPYSAYEPFPSGAWGEQRAPVSVSGTYYYDAYLNGGSYILSVATSESIDTYAIRTKDLVDTLLNRTGSGKVIIVAHSMGGLVARRYLDIFGADKVAALIMVGTPNHGIESSVAQLCPVLGADTECTEMTAGSPLLAKLNDPSRQLSIPLFVIAGSGCDMNGQPGDGVVTLASAGLPDARLTVVNGSCRGADVLHTALLDPTRYPAAYDAIKTFIGQNEPAR